MKRFGMVALVMVGFVAGIAFVYSCGGGGDGTLGSSVFAQDLTGIEMRLDAITAAILDTEKTESYLFTTTLNAGAADTSSLFDSTNFLTASVFCNNDSNSPHLIGFNLRVYIDGMAYDSLPGNAETNMGPFDIHGDAIALNLRNNGPSAENINCMIRLEK